MVSKRVAPEEPVLECALQGLVCMLVAIRCNEPEPPIYKNSYGGTNWRLDMRAAVVVMTPHLGYISTWPAPRLARENPEIHEVMRVNALTVASFSVGSQQLVPRT